MHTLAFADFSGNRQYVTVGHLAANPKAFIFLMDYERRQRLKIFGTARVSDDPALMRATAIEGYDADVERVIVFTVGGWTANCPQHIPLRLSAVTVERAICRAERAHRCAGNREREAATGRVAQP